MPCCFRHLAAAQPTDYRRATGERVQQAAACLDGGGAAWRWGGEVDFYVSVVDRRVVQLSVARGVVGQIAREDLLFTVLS